MSNEATRANSLLNALRQKSQLFCIKETCSFKFSNMNHFGESQTDSECSQTGKVPLAYNLSQRGEMEVGNGIAEDKSSDVDFCSTDEPRKNLIHIIEFLQTMDDQFTEVLSSLLWVIEILTCFCRMSRTTLRFLTRLLPYSILQSVQFWRRGLWFLSNSVGIKFDCSALPKLTHQQ